MTKLEQLKAALAAATPDAWESRPVPDSKCIVIAQQGMMYPHAHVTTATAQYESLTEREYANAELIVLAHNLMPKLLAVAEEAHTLVEKLKPWQVHESHYAALEKALEDLQ